MPNKKVQTKKSCVPKKTPNHKWHIGIKVSACLWLIKPLDFNHSLNNHFHLAEYKVLD